MDLDTFLTAADTSRVQAGGGSIFESLGRVDDFVAGAVVSGMASIYNTGAYYANKVFGADIEQVDTYRKLQEFDNNWANYYEANKGVLDTVGFIGGAFIPGGAALKGLKLAQQGKAVGPFSRVLGYTVNKQQEYLRKGLQEIAQDGGTVFNRLHANKIASMAYGAADNVLQAGVFETAAVLGMHQSPFFDGDSWGDIAWDVVKTSLAGGLLGGGVEALFTNKIFKDAGKLVDKTQRKYDTVAAFEKMGMNFGDEAFSLMDEMFNLPKEILAADKKLPFTYRLNGKDHSIELDTSQLYDKKLAETTNKAIQKFEAKLANIVENDTSVGRPFAVAMLDILKQGKAMEQSDTVIRQELGNFLFGLKSIEGIGAGRVNLKDPVTYFTPAAKPVDFAKNPQSFWNQFTDTRVSDKSKAIRIVGSMEDAKLGNIGLDAATYKNAWADGFDAMMDGNGVFHFNPDSKIFRPASDPVEGTAKVTFNLRTKTTNDTAVGTVADVATADKPLRVSLEGVVSGNKVFRFHVNHFNLEADSVEATARHLWASQIKASDLGGRVVDIRDHALIDRIFELKDLTYRDREVIKIKDLEGNIESLLEVSNRLTNMRLEAKLRTAEDYFKKHGNNSDHRELAYKLNVDESWLVRAIETEFNNAALRTEGVARELKSYAARDNLLLTYDTNVKKLMEEGDFATNVLAYEYRKQIAVEKAQEAAAAVLRGDYSQFIDLKANELTKKFDATGAGATAAGFSNADYGDLGRLWAQDVGRAVNQTKQRRINAAMDRIQPHAASLLADPKQGAELAAILTRVRRSDQPLSLLDGKVVDLHSKKDYEAAIAAGDTQAASEVQFKVMIPVGDKTYKFLQEHHAMHKAQLSDRRVLASAQGTVLHWEDDALYLPPIDTRKVPYFAFVREHTGKAMGTSEVAMITARTPQELQELASKVGDEFQVIFKGDTEDFFKAQGDYEYQRALNRPTIDPYLRKQGKLGDFLPSLEPKAAIEDFINYHQRRETQIVRDAVEVRYGQTFSELRWLSEQNTKVEKSKFEFLAKLSQRNISDPFGDLIKTALDISKRSEFTLWHQANEFVDAVGTRAYQATEKAFHDAKQGKISWEEANELLDRVGLGKPFKDQEAFLTAQVGNDRNVIKTAIAKANMLLSTFALRFDFVQSLINIVSTPVLLGTELASIRSAVKNDSELAGKLNDLTTLKVPGQELRIPSTTKLVANAFANYWTPQGKELLNGRYKQIGAVKDTASQYHQMIEDLSLSPNLVPTKWAKKAEEWTEKVSTATGNNFSEDFTRFVSADVMRQLTDPLVAAGKMSEKEQNAYISIFVNRVQGNYIASQRPIMFQGTIGAAIGLFQTYQFNLFQQLFRHIGNRDARAVAVMGGIQGTIFGLNGLPMFDAVNTYLIGQANINEGHHDAYSAMARVVPKEVADWAMYGTASAFPLFSDKAPSLYTRGDLNPRHVTIVPTAFDQIPAVEATTRVVKSLLGMGQQLGNGADISAALLHGLEHNGINRPLAGIAQVFRGEATTNSGSLIAATSDWSTIANYSRIVGAKPMDESIALNHKFRLEAYKAADRERIEKLGTVVKQKIRDGSLTDEDVSDFAARYAQVGGRVESYGAALQRWTKNANKSVINTVSESHKTSYGKRMLELMGGEPIDDFYNQTGGSEE